eukprot:4406464-Ditylum_brightwellii.AAC.1
MYNNYGFFKNKGIDILHNIQSLLSAQRLERPPDNVCANTTCKEADSSSSNNDDNIEHIGTHKDVEKRGQICQRDLIKAPLIE